MTISLSCLRVQNIRNTVSFRSNKILFWIISISVFLIWNTVSRRKSILPSKYPRNVFICWTYLGEKCPLAKAVAQLLYPDDIVVQYSGQDTSESDILIVVCGCSQAFLFNGKILYIDNGHGDIYLPGVSKKKVVYAGVSSPSPNNIILRQIQLFFAGLWTSISFNQLDINKLLRPRKQLARKRSFMIYLKNHFIDFQERAFDSLFQLAKTRGFSLPVASRNCHGRCSETLPNSSHCCRKRDSNIRIYSDYRFALVIENSFVHGYVTERILDAFMAGTIPVYYGTMDVFKLFNKKSFIYYDDKNPELTFERIAYLETNDTAYNEVLSQPILANGKNTLKEYFSVRDDIGSGRLKKLIRRTITLDRSYLKKPMLVLFPFQSEKDVQKLRHINFVSKIPIAFYMYDEPEITMDNWTRNCGTRDTTDITLLNMFRKHPWRTKIPSEARVFIISTPIYQSFKCGPHGHRKRLDAAMKRLTSHKYFKRYNGIDHLMMSRQYVFSAWTSPGIMSKTWWQKLKEVTATRYEYYGMSKWENFSSFNVRRRVPKSLFDQIWERTKRSIIVPSSTPIDLKVVIPDFAEWKNRPTFIWYHIRHKAFLHGATKLRRMPVERSELFPGDIGYEIGRYNWIEGWNKSKFCLVVRGDTPSSHSFYNAIVSSCIPVLISDPFDLVALPFKNILELESFTVLIPENILLNSPEMIASILSKLPDKEIQDKLAGLKRVQLILILNHPHCVLPELLLGEMSKIITNVFNMH